jgi:hypothetical protein
VPRRAALSSVARYAHVERNELFEAAGSAGAPRQPNRDVPTLAAHRDDVGAVAVDRNGELVRDCRWI